EMGHFDTDMGVSTQEWMQSQDPKLFSRDGLKALLTDTNYRDSMLGKAPEMADQITWVAMWQACKREARDQNKNLTEEQILQKAGERFEDIVMYTQVYDSVLSRSSNMRSKSMFMSMATSFMAEPTTWANMVEHSIREMTRGNAKAGIRELGAVAVSSIAVAMMSSLVYAMRDDDDDETYTEKFMASFLGELLDELNPLTHLPIVQDVWNIMSGWSVERADMTLVENLYKSVDKLVEAWATDTKGMSDEELQEHSKKLSDAYWSMASTISAFVGVPMQNVRKDVMGLIHTIENAGSGMTTTKESVLDAMGAEFRKSIPFLARFMPEKKRQQKLYDAIMSGDDEYAQRLGGQYANEIAFHAALRKALRENDDRIEAGARARYEGNIAEYIRIVNEIKAEGNFSQDDIVASMNTLINQWTNEAKESDGNGAPAAVSMFKNSDLFDALFSGDETSADVISEYLVEMKVADGKTEEEAVKNLNSAITSEIRRRYKEGELTREEYKDWMLQYSTKSEKELDKELLKEDYLSETGFEWSDHEEAYLSGQVTTQDTISWIMRIEGKNKEDAQKILRRVDFRAADPDTTLQTYQIDQYYSTIQSTGISIPVWTTYCQQSAKCKGADANGDGKTDPGSKKVQVMKVIDSLPISNAQKDELYRLNGWSEKTINEAPWR
ncbi:MAG: hypothetical protein IKD75_08530, partial [Prevotella sp.]|nr:hypothetical protein [Prevotella sp.]